MPMISENRVDREPEVTVLGKTSLFCWNGAWKITARPS